MFVYFLKMFNQPLNKTFDNGNLPWHTEKQHNQSQPPVQMIDDILNYRKEWNNSKKEHHIDLKLKLEDIENNFFVSIQVEEVIFFSRKVIHFIIPIMYAFTLIVFFDKIFNL